MTTSSSPRWRWLPNAAASVLLAAVASASVASADPIFDPNPIDPCILNPALCDFDPCENNPDLYNPPQNAAPDLHIMAIDAIRVGSECAVVVEVENLGTGAAGPFDVDLFFGHGQPPEIGELSDTYKTVGGLAAGTSTDVVFSIPAGLAGTFVNRSALVDSTRQVEESNEGNNSWFRCTNAYLGCLE